MNAGTIVGIVGIVITTAISVWAIRDVRDQVKKLLTVERDRVFVNTMNDMVWLFLDPSDRVYPTEIAKGLEEFGLLVEALNPERPAQASKAAVENEALALAEKLVQSGRANWKEGWDKDKVQKVLQSWQAQKNAVRVHNMYDKIPPSIIGQQGQN